MLKKTEVRIYRVKRLCDQCLAQPRPFLEPGEMLPTGMTLTSIPPQYPHQCGICGHTDTYLCTYPHLAYEDVPE